MLKTIYNGFLTLGIYVFAHLTQTRYAQNNVCRNEDFMTQNSIANIPIADVPFTPIGDKELSIILSERKRKLINDFSRRAVISVIVTAIVMIMEYIGKYNSDNLKAIPGEFTFIIIALIIFNLLSFGYVVLKQRINTYADHLCCVYGTVSEKYDSRSLSTQNRQRSQDYILFDTENIHCVTAIPANNREEFKKLTPGSRILIVKSSPYGDAHYELYTNL